MSSPRRLFLAYVLPFAIFMLGLALVSGVESLAGPSDQFVLAHPVYWIYPLQTLACAAALGWFWKNYELGSFRALPLAIGAGLVVFFLWVSPQMVFGRPARLEGFDPGVFGENPTLYWGTMAARFLRLVIVVPLVEEIFWRGFLQRYLIDERFPSVPFGKYTPLSFWGVVVAFTLIHNPPDYPAAILTGAIYGWLAVRTKSLLVCVVAHATTNLALGLYIVATRQWGFW